MLGHLLDLLVSFSAFLGPQTLSSWTTLAGRLLIFVRPSLARTDRPAHCTEDRLLQQKQQTKWFETSLYQSTPDTYGSVASV